MEALRDELVQHDSQQIDGTAHASAHEDADGTADVQATLDGNPPRVEVVHQHEVSVPSDGKRDGSGLPSVDVSPELADQRIVASTSSDQTLLGTTMVSYSVASR